MKIMHLSKKTLIVFANIRRTSRAGFMTAIPSTRSNWLTTVLERSSPATPRAAAERQRYTLHQFTKTLHALMLSKTISNHKICRHLNFQNSKQVHANIIAVLMELLRWESKQTAGFSLASLKMKFDKAICPDACCYCLGFLDTNATRHISQHLQRFCNKNHAILGQLSKPDQRTIDVFKARVAFELKNRDALLGVNNHCPAIVSTESDDVPSDSELDKFSVD